MVCVDELTRCEGGESVGERVYDRNGVKVTVRWGKFSEDALMQAAQAYADIFESKRPNTLAYKEEQGA
jgi:hypothetical protein